MEWADTEKLGGQPDGFERLWTPHRLAYVKNASVRETITESSQCPLCKSDTADDAENLIVHRGAHTYVVLNLYPYNPGHLMVCPYRHVGWYTEITRAERDEMAEFTQQAMRLLQRLTGTAGFNIGMNQGVTGGAGIHEHLHQHVVPRWIGDANFLPIIGQTKAVPELLGDTRARLAAAWKEEADA